MQQFHEAPLKDELAYLFLDGVNLKVLRENGRKCAQMLVAYGVQADGTRRLLSFMRSQGERTQATSTIFTGARPNHLFHLPL